MSHRRKVLMLQNDLSRTGAPKIALDVVEGLRGDFDFRTITGNSGPLIDRARSLAPCVEFHPPGASVRMIVTKLLARPRVAGWLSVWRPDLIYVNSIASLRLLPILRIPQRLPVLLHVHELESLLDETISRSRELPIHRPIIFLAVGQAVREALLSRGVPAANIRLTHEFASASLANSAEPPARPANQPMVVCGSGSASWRKGATLWIQTLAALRKQRPDLPVRFRWIGETINNGLPTQARLLGVADHVDFVGEVTDAPAEFAKADCLFLSSWEDPFPLVVLEAMSVARPVICFADGGGSPEQVGETGVVVDGFDPESAARAIASLAEDRERLARLGHAARERVLGHFTDLLILPKIRHAMHEAIAGGASA